MALLACVSPVVSCVFRPLMDALQRCLQSAAGELFSWAAGEIRSRFSAWRNAVVEVSALTASLVGAEDTLQEIRSCLSDDSVGIVGIYGMGGIGKTALLQRINNDLCESGTQGLFDLVIFITVSNEINVARIQKEIGARVGLDFSAADSAADGSSSSPVEEQAVLLFRALSKRRFLLLLDDLWQKLDLIMVGIPSPAERRRHRKIVFTTRSQDVCSDMDADKRVEVKPLDPARSWELFCNKVRPEATFKNPSVQPLAKQVVAKCGGLPLGLVTVGRAMAHKTLPEDWKHAVTALDNSAEKLRGMDQVLSALKFSYDYLQSDMMRSALLFCAMYPEDFDIPREELVEYWIGEGLLDDGDDDVVLDHTRDRGHALITDLQNACLLEAGNEHAKPIVRMHDAVRDMAIWMNTQECEKVDGFLVFAEGKSTPVTKMPRKEHVLRIWMCQLDVELSPPGGLQNCPNTRTLLLYRASLGASALRGLLEFMRTLRVLDLSETGLKEVPEEIGLLVDLQYLNLSRTKIMSLPKELGELIKLRQLVLLSTFELRAIPWESIGRLSHLQVLNMLYTGYKWDHGKMAAIQDMIREGEDQQQQPPLDANASGGAGRQLEVRDLEDLRRLQDLRIDIRTPRALERLLRSNTLCGHLRALRLRGDETHPFEGELPFSRRDMPCLEELVLDECKGDLKVVVEGCGGGGASSDISSLRRLHIRYCDGLKSLILVGRFPCLERISLSECRNMEELVLGDDDGVGRGGSLGTILMASSYIPSLRGLHITYSDGLKALILVGRFPCLEQINLFGCGGMEELVLGDDDGVGRGESLGSSFPMLKTVFLYDLPGLRSVGPQALLLPSLETMYVSACPQLRRLPLGPGGAPKLSEILGEQEWWDALQWDASDGGSSKLAYASCFRPWD